MNCPLKEVRIGLYVSVAIATVAIIFLINPLPNWDIRNPIFVVLGNPFSCLFITCTCSVYAFGMIFRRLILVKITSFAYCGFTAINFFLALPAYVSNLPAHYNKFETFGSVVMWFGVALILVGLLFRGFVALDQIGQAEAAPIKPERRIGHVSEKQVDVDSTTAQTLADSDNRLEKCEHCGTVIETSETPWVFNSQVVCAKCWQRLKEKNHQ